MSLISDAKTSCLLSLGLASLADFYPERILERLLKDFQQGSSLSTSNKDHSLEFRLKTGEVLMRASRAMGGYHHHFLYRCFTVAYILSFISQYVLKGISEIQSPMDKQLSNTI